MPADKPADAPAPKSGRTKTTIKHETFPEEVKEAMAKMEKENESLKEENMNLKAEKTIRESKALVAKKLTDAHLPAGTYDDLKEHLVGKDEKYIDKQIGMRKSMLSSILKDKVLEFGEVFHESASDTKNYLDGIPMNKK